MNSLKSFKYGLKRHLQKIGHAYDITKDTAFKESQKAFAIACKELKAEGRGIVKNHKEIRDEGKYIIYYIILSIFQVFNAKFRKLADNAGIRTS